MEYLILEMAGEEIMFAGMCRECSRNRQAALLEIP